MKEQLSALMDGELDLDTNPYLYTALCKSNEAEHCWATYHLIGDVMRNEFQLQAKLRAKVMQQLESEPVVLAPQHSLRSLMQMNRIIPLAASAAAMAFVGWMVWQSQNIGIPSQTPAPSIAQNTISPEALNNYMLAHHEYAPSTGIQRTYNIESATYSEAAHN